MDNEKKIKANELAWAKLSKDHYETYKKRLVDPHTKLNPIVEKELGDIRGKHILHLQCNTGADSILLARKGAIVTGVDLVEDNIKYAQQLANDFKMNNLTFIASDVLKLEGKIDKKFDMIVTFDGVIGWLPDLDQWGKVLHHYLNEHGEFYLHDAHPVALVFDEEEMSKGHMIARYPYFGKDPDMDPYIGGYASEAKLAENYYWNHTMEDIIMGLINNGLTLTSVKEHEKCVDGMGGDEVDQEGLSYYKHYLGKIPMALSLKAKK